MCREIKSNKNLQLGLLFGTSEQLGFQNLIIGYIDQMGIEKNFEGSNSQLIPFFFVFIQRGSKKS